MEDKSAQDQKESAVLDNAPKPLPSVGGGAQFESSSSGNHAKWWHNLGTPVDGDSLAVFRILTGLAILANIWLSYSSIQANYVEPQFHFTCLNGLQTLPGNGMFIYYGVMSFSAICLTLGLFYRPAAAISFITQTYLLLLDKAYYQNYLYLICLISFLFMLVPADRVWSMDNSDKKISSLVSKWSLLIFKIQITLVYVFGGLARINSDWFHGEPQTTTLNLLGQHSIWGSTQIAQFMSQPPFAQFITFAAPTCDFLIPVLLWFTPTFWIGVLVAIIFQVLTAMIFPAGSFPYIYIAALSAFMPPSTIRKLLQRFPFAKAKDVAFEPEKTERVMLTVLAIYVLIQLTVPLRQFLYPGVTAWTEQGQRFSWQPTIRAKKVENFALDITNPKTNEVIQPELQNATNRLQQAMMVKRPDMIIQFVHYIADKIEHEKGVRPVIKVLAVESLNNRPPQNLVDPEVDLAAEKESLLPAKWIVPLK